MKKRKPGRGELRPPVALEPTFFPPLVRVATRAAGPQESAGKYGGSKLVGRDPEAEEGQAVHWLHSELRKKVGYLNIESGNDSRRAKAVKWICVLLSEEGVRVHTPAVKARGGVGGSRECFAEPVGALLVAAPPGPKAAKGEQGGEDDPAAAANERMAGCAIPTLVGFLRPPEDRISDPLELENAQLEQVPRTARFQP